MRKERYYELRDKLLEDAVDVSTAKGADYTQKSEDALKNFKGVAEDMGLTPMQTLGVYMKKHQDAISSFIKHGGQLESEPIRERIIDNINYLCLLYGLIIEQEGDAQLKDIEGRREAFHRQAFRAGEKAKDEAFHQTRLMTQEEEEALTPGIKSNTPDEEARSGYVEGPDGQTRFIFVK